MALGINTNVASLTAQNQLNKSQDMNSQALERLSSGLRINSAKDDAAGLAISSRFSSQVRGLDVAARNANDGISLAQTAEGALESISNSLQRIRELAVQSANATNSASDRAALDTEAQALKEEINRVAEQTSFNGVKLLDGSFKNQSFQIGANAGETITISAITNAKDTALGSYDAAEVTGVAATGFADTIAAGGVTIGGVDIGPIEAASSATERAGQIRDAVNAIADQTGVYAKNDTSNSLTLVSSTNDIVIDGTETDAVKSGLAPATTTKVTETGFDTLDLNTTAGADTALKQMDAALSAVNTARSELGAVQNRFESTISNIASTSENLSAANGRIQDADFAAETAKLSKSQVLQQAGISVLSQANARPQQVLSLLQ